LAPGAQIATGRREAPEELVQSIDSQPLKQARIVVVGSLNMDLVVRAPRHPQPGETIIGSDFATFPGGKGANQAVAAARLGGLVTMIGRVGDDLFGEALLTAAAADRIDTTFISKDPQARTGIGMITLDGAGQNTIVVASGANACLTAAHVQAAEAAFQGAAVLLLQLETPLETISSAIELAHKHSLQVVLNPAPARELSQELLSNIDYLIPNQNELALLTGVATVPAAVKTLKDIGVNCVIVTMGGEGVTFTEDGELVYLPAYPVQVVDTVAAGDAFVGAFAVALTEGQGTGQAATWGNAAGALAVTRPGAQPSLPTRDELERFLAGR
jgi:ribokinase